MNRCYWEQDGTCGVVIPIKLEFSASVGFIHKENAETFTYYIKIYDMI